LIIIFIFIFILFNLKFFIKKLLINLLKITKTNSETKTLYTSVLCFIIVHYDVGNDAL